MQHMVFQICPAFWVATGWLWLTLMRSTSPVVVGHLLDTVGACHSDVLSWSAFLNNMQPFVDCLAVQKAHCWRDSSKEPSSVFHCGNIPQNSQIMFTPRIKSSVYSHHLKQKLLCFCCFWSVWKQLKCCIANPASRIQRYSLQCHWMKVAVGLLVRSGVISRQQLTPRIGWIALYIQCITWMWLTYTLLMIALIQTHTSI